MATYNEINEAFQQQLQGLLQQEQDPVKIVENLDGFLKENFDTSINAFATMKKQEKDYLQTDPVDALFGGVRAMMQGMTLGLGDEIEGRLRAKLGQYTNIFGDEGKAYEQIKNEIQAGISGFEKANPGWSFGLEMIGGLAIPYLGTATAGARAGVRGGAKLLEKILNPITTRSPVQPLLGKKGAELITQTGVGAGLGATYSYGKTDEVSGVDTVLGGAFGGLGYKAGEVIGEGVRNLRNKGGVVGAIGQKIPDISGGELPDEAIPVQVPFTKKPPTVSEPSGDPNLPVRTTDPVSIARDRKAMKEIISALDEQGTSFDELLMRLDDYVKTNRGEHVSIYDLATMPDPDTGIPMMPKGAVGDLTLGNVLSSPKASGVANRNMLRRALGAKDRAIEDVNDLFGRIPPEFGDVITFKEHLKKLGSEKAKPYYGQSDPTAINDRNIATLISDGINGDPLIKSAFDDAYRSMNTGTPKYSSSTDPRQLTVRQFDQFKKALDSKINTLIKEGDWFKTSALLDYKNNLVSRVDDYLRDVNPITAEKYKGESPYKIAREIFSGGESSDMAFDLGKNAVANVDKEAFNEDLFINAFNKLTNQEKKMAILGLGAGLRDKLKRQTVEELNVRKVTQGGSGKNSLQDILRHAIENVDLNFEQKQKWAKKLKRFEEAQKAERTLFSNFRNVFRGSQTAEKMASQRRAEGTAEEFVSDVVQTLGTQSPQYTLASKSAQALSARGQRKRIKELQKLSDAISSRLLSQGSQRVRTNIQELRDYQRLLQQRTPQMFRSGLQNPLMYSLLDERR